MRRQVGGRRSFVRVAAAAGGGPAGRRWRRDAEGSLDEEEGGGDDQKDGVSSRFKARRIRLLHGENLGSTGAPSAAFDAGEADGGEDAAILGQRTLFTLGADEHIEGL